jgi:hypothetical protein
MLQFYSVYTITLNKLFTIMYAFINLYLNQAGLLPLSMPQQQQHKAVSSPTAVVAHQRLIRDNSISSNSSAGGNASHSVAVPPAAALLPQSPSIRGERGVEASKKREGMRKDTEVLYIPHT